MDNGNENTDGKSDAVNISSDNTAPHLRLGAVSYVGRSVGSRALIVYISPGAPLHARLKCQAVET